MGAFSKLFGTSEARADLAEARNNLADVSSGITEETDDYYAANQRVIDAEQAVKDSRRR